MKISYIILSAIIFIIFYYLFFRNLYSSGYKIVNNKNNYNKLMIVAHPDDELIFGGRELIAESGWKVVCITCGSLLSNNKLRPCSNNIRKKEFKNVMDNLNCSYEIWDYEDSLFNDKWNETLLSNDLFKIINEKPYQKIVTHNLDGEYGHVQHKKISKLVHDLKPNNLYVFGYDTKQINPYLNKLYSLLKLYSSQKKIIKKYNKYIVHQTISSASSCR